MVAAKVLLASRGVPASPDALAGALLELEHRALHRAFMRAHLKT